MDKMKPFGRVFFKSSLINLRFAQKQDCVFVQCSIVLVFSNIIRHQTVCCVSALPKRTFLTGNPARRCAVSLPAALDP